MSKIFILHINNAQKLLKQSRTMSDASLLIFFCIYSYLYIFLHILLRPDFRLSFFWRKAMLRPLGYGARAW